MIVAEYIEIPMGSRNKKYYNNLGYVEYKKDDGKKYFYVKINDLSHSTQTKIPVKCDNDGCDVIWMQPYKNYLNIMKKYGTCYCHKCQYLHNQQTCIEKYGETSYAKTQESKDKHVETNLKNWGTPYLMQNEEIKKKVAETNIEKYGSISPFGNEEVREKSKKTIENNFGSMNDFYKHIHELSKVTDKERYGSESFFDTDDCKEKTKMTNLAKYGFENVMQCDEIKQKVEATMLEKYGVKNPFQSEEIKEKIKKTNLEKYGYENAGQSPIIREKMNKTLYYNSTQKTSSQQRYIANLLNGILNYPLKKYSLDIYMPNEQIDVEIDFGGHDLNVKLGKTTQEEFNKHEMIREKIIRSQGIKIIRIISPKDKMPSDQKILQMYEFAKEYFNTGHTWINFYIEDGKYRNAENPSDSGAFYDFGELRNGKNLPKFTNKEVSNIT